MKRPVVVVPYDPTWPKAFEEEAEKIASVLKDNLIRTHHVGSTAVPGLAAKPVIDMIPEVADIQAVDGLTQSFEKMGYEAKGEMGMPFRRFFVKKGAPLSYHVHIWEKDNPEIQRMLLFRDYLIQHPEDLKKYGTLKMDLAKIHPDDIMAYCDKKTDFVLDLDQKAGFKGFRFLRVATTYEKEAYHRIRKEAIFDLLGVVYDPNHPTLTAPNHHHFVLYKGDIIVGVAHLEFLEENKVALRPFAIDPAFRNRGYATYFFRVIEKWLRHQHKTQLVLHANPEALNFYKSLGFYENPFTEKKEDRINIHTIGLAKDLKS